MSSIKSADSGKALVTVHFGQQNNSGAMVYDSNRKQSWLDWLGNVSMVLERSLDKDPSEITASSSDESVEEGGVAPLPDRDANEVLSEKPKLIQRSRAQRTPDNRPCVLHILRGSQPICIQVTLLTCSFELHTERTNECKHKREIWIGGRLAKNNSPTS